MGDQTDLSDLRQNPRFLDCLEPIIGEIRPPPPKSRTAVLNSQPTVIDVTRTVVGVRKTKFL